MVLRLRSSILSPSWSGTRDEIGASPMLNLRDNCERIFKTFGAATYAAMLTQDTLNDHLFESNLNSQRSPSTHRTEQTRAW